ncbi:MAG: DUF166 domain-containing protein [Candidatus Thermoplasmatota archaeon]|nr:DUF166 domain-containing protein [Candidatus Thermoplasmatota archaeon]
MRKEVTFGKEYSGNDVVAALRSAALSTGSCRFDYTPERVYLKAQKKKEVFSNLRLVVGETEIPVLASEKNTLQGEAKHSAIVLDIGEELDWDEMEAFEKRLLEALERGPTYRVERGAEKEEEIQKRELTAEELERIGKGKMTILALVQGEYGERIAKNVQDNGPEGFKVEMLMLPVDLPLVIDDPAEFLPEPVPKADLVLALQENSSAAQLIVDIVKAADAMALIAPMDSSQWLPLGMKTQIKRELSKTGIATAFPRPFCTLDAVGNPIIDKFAEFFGRPILDVKVEKNTVTGTEVVRDSPCGCGRFVADKLPGTEVRDAVEKAGLAHHHYPCLCSMNVEDDLGDTLMHVSGLQMKKTVDKSLEPIRKKEASYVDPTQM